MIFLEIALSWNYLFIVPYHAGKFERNLWADPEIRACIPFDQNWAKIAHLTQKRFFNKFHLSDLHLFIASYHAAKFLKSL